MCCLQIAKAKNIYRTVHAGENGSAAVVKEVAGGYTLLSCVVLRWCGCGLACFLSPFHEESGGDRRATGSVDT